MSYARIGEALGVTRQRAHQLVKAALKDLQRDVDQEAAGLRALELSTLDDIQRAHWAKVLDGEVEHAELVLKVMQRRAKLTGIDAPQVIDANAHVKLYDVANSPEDL